MRVENWIYTLPLRLRSLFRRKDVERELEEEVQFHLENQIALQEAKGVPPEEARYAAMRVVGNTTLLKEEARVSWGWEFWSSLLQDFRYALRLLRKSPGFSLTAIVTLALGIGASSAVFTILDSTLLKPLSYRDSGDLVALWERVLFLPPGPLGPNPRHVDVWMKRATSFESMAMVRQGSIGLSLGTDHPQLVGTVLSATNVFDVLRVTPLMGRTFRPEDGIAGRDNVVVLTHSLWQSLFRGDPQVVGKSVRLGDVPREVVGVLPANFHFPNRNALRAFPSKQAATSVPEPSVFVPAALDLTGFSWNGEYGNWIALGRLKKGVDTARAQAELNAIEKQIVEEMPAQQRDARPDALLALVQPLQEAVVGGSKKGLWLLMAAVMGLMSIACVNLANTQLARSLARHREASVRSALGAPKWRLVWNTLVENLIVAAVAGVVGVVIASVGLDEFRRYAVVDLPRLSEVRLNTTVLLFAIGLTFASTIVFSVLPALYLLRTDPQTFLQQSNSRSVGVRHRGPLHKTLIGLQVFGCTALLFVTALFAKNLMQLVQQERGFAADSVAFAQVNLSAQHYGPPETRVQFIEGVLGNVRGIAGVEAAGFVSAAPLEGESWIEAVRRGDRRGEKAPLVSVRWASAGYFEAMRHTLVAGRFFEERDGNSRGAILSEGEAKTLFGEESALGRTIETQGRTFTVVGVVSDARTLSLKATPGKVLYLYYKDRAPATLFFMARGAQPAEVLASSMRQAIWKYAPNATIARAKSLDAQVNESVAGERFQTMVLTAFGVSALLLAMLGIYGVLSYSVATRKQEIGVRMAVGASRAAIYRMTLGEAGAPVVVGLALGLGACVIAGRAVQGLLYGSAGVDVMALAAVSVLFLACATAAALLPARRAASLDPMQSLRSE